MGLLERRLEVRHGLVLIEALLLAVTQTEPRLRLAPERLGLHADVEALLVEVAGRAPVVELLKLFGDLAILLKTLFNHAFPVQRLTVHENLTELLQASLGLHKLLLAALIMTHLLLQLLIDFDGAGSSIGMTCDVEEVHVRVEVTHLHEENSLGASRNLVF